MGIVRHPRLLTLNIDVVGPLINANAMFGELAIARILVPDRYAIDVATTRVIHPVADSSP